MQVSGLAAVVTGGGSGLGAATAVHLAGLGCKVAVVDINQAAAEAVALAVGGVGIGCDVADAASGEAAFAAASAAHGPVRILVNCAGVGTAGRIVGRDGPMKLEAFERVIRVNLIGSFNMLRLAAAEMSGADALEENERGVIVNTASIAAYEGQVGQPAYAASKGGIVGLTLPAARELARVGVRVGDDRAGVVPARRWWMGCRRRCRRIWGRACHSRSGWGGLRSMRNWWSILCGTGFLNGEVIRLDGALRMGPR